MKKQIQKPEMQEIATAGGLDDISRYYSGAPHDADYRQSALANQVGNDEAWHKAAEFARADGQVAACMGQRHLAVTSFAWEVIPGDDSKIAQDVADFITQQFERIRFNDISEKLLWARFYGASVAEALWGMEGNKIILQDLRVRNLKRFHFTPGGDALLRTHTNPNGQIVPENKFIILRSGSPHSDNPFGEGLADHLYWPVRLKKLGVAEWTLFLEKFASPTITGKYPANASQDERDILLNIAKSVRRDTAAVMPDSMMLEILEISRRGDGGYVTFADYMDKTISKIIIGQTMTTDDGASLSQAQVHKVVADRIIKADAELICEGLNDTIVKWLCGWNFANAPQPTLRRIMPEPFDEKARAETLATLYNIGFKPDLNRIQEDFGEGFAERDLSAGDFGNKNPPPTQSTKNNFAEAKENPDPPLKDNERGDLKGGHRKGLSSSSIPRSDVAPPLINKDNIDNIVDLLEEGDRLAFAEMLNPMRKALAKAKSFDDLNRRLTRLEGKGKINKLGKLLQAATGFAHIKASDDIKDDPLEK